MKAAAEGKRKAELAKKQNQMTQSCTEANQNQDCDSSPSHSSSVHRSQVRIFFSNFFWLYWVKTRLVSSCNSFLVFFFNLMSYVGFYVYKLKIL